MVNEKTFFLTGVTGTLGREILKRLLETTPHRFFLLIRSTARLSAQDRLKKILNSHWDKVQDRVSIIEGDVTQPQFGLEKHAYEKMQRQIDRIYHIAALTSLNGTQEDCFRINLNGTMEMLKFAWGTKQAGGLERFIYFSTAYAAGSLQTYCSLEDSLPEHQAHANYYEASKYAAETRVREEMANGLPVTIFRPSIVVGDSRTGAVSEFNVIYPFMKLFAHGILRKLPTKLTNTFNIVPIDFVVDASCLIVDKPETAGKTFHLVTKNPPSIGMLLEMKEREFPQMPSIEILDPETFDKEQLEPGEQMMFDMLHPYLGYLNDHLTFETKNTEEALKGTGIRFPKTDYDFLLTLTRYAIDAGYILQ